MSDVGIRLGGPDNASNRFLADWPYGIFISPLVENRDKRLHEFLRINNFENGPSLFLGESDSDIQAFRDLTGHNLDGVSNTVIHHIFIHWFKRVRNYGRIEFFASAEIFEARIEPADHRTIISCIGHAGRRVNVIDAAARIGWMKGLTPEEYGVLAYGVDFGFPPFDLECRCEMEGIIPGVDFSEPLRRPVVTRTKWDRLEHIAYICSKTPIDEMSEEKFIDLLELMLRVSAELSENPDPQSRLERRIGEAFAARGRKAEAIRHLEKALSIRPKVGCKKLLQKLRS
ncbi:MAG: tetratricopeptide repeat protein [Blastocatellia bacterium]